MNDFFDLPEDVFSDKKQNVRKEDTNIYNPNPELSKDGVYKSAIRFIPNLRNKELSKYKKYIGKIYNPLTKKSLYIDCPSNEGKPSILWDIDKIKYRLMNDDPETYKIINDNFSRWYDYYSYIYVKRDLQRPELENTIKIFKYRTQINDMIESLMNPDESELVESVKKVNPFHLLKGRDFLCVVSKKTKSFRDWTKCKFLDDDMPLIYKVNGQDVVVEHTQESIEQLMSFFNENAPSLDNYMHKSWTDEDYVNVAQAIKAAIPYPDIINLLINETKDDKIKELLSNGQSAPSPKIMTEDTVFSNPTPSQPVDNSTPAETLSSAPSPSVPTSDISTSMDTPGDSKLNSDEYSNILKNLDLD